MQTYFTLHVFFCPDWSCGFRAAGMNMVRFKGWPVTRKKTQTSTLDLTLPLSISCILITAAALKFHIKTWPFTSDPHTPPTIFFNPQLIYWLSFNYSPWFHWCTGATNITFYLCCYRNLQVKIIFNLIPKSTSHKQLESKTKYIQMSAHILAAEALLKLSWIVGDT